MSGAGVVMLPGSSGLTAPASSSNVALATSPAYLQLLPTREAGLTKSLPP